MSLGINCPFCGEKLEIEYYSNGKGKRGNVMVFCNNDSCKVKPCTDAMNPSATINEARLFGKINL